MPNQNYEDEELALPEDAEEEEYDDPEEGAQRNSIQEYLNALPKNLLTRENEADIGRAMETGAYLKKLEQSMHEIHGHPPEAWEIVSHILQLLSKELPLVSALRQSLGLHPGSTLMHAMEIRDAIDGVITTETDIVKRVAQVLNEKAEKTAERIIALSCGLRLLPPEATDIMGSTPLLELDPDDILLNSRNALFRPYYRKIHADAKAAAIRLTEYNLRLVVSIAKRYRGKGVELLDMIQEGNMGLMQAVKKFSYRRGNKFSTYGNWWIRQFVGRACAEQEYLICVPAKVQTDIKEVLRARRDFLQNSGREPSPEELAEILGETADHVSKTLRAQYIQHTQSLSLLVGPENDTPIEDFLADPNAIDPGDIIANTPLNYRALQQILLEAGLTPRVFEAICARFGINESGAAKTLEKTGSQLGVSRERARQLEAKAMKALRQPAIQEKLQKFFGLMP
ncbi:MAG: sigma-70 family RNA polymerase sigma factor [Candidatus Wildermuthbacteria bacterium]|nr:sigma-70 family RNA polymerase sigma factor [Candidatus Wildermuthbacteria bacterium]